MRNKPLSQIRMRPGFTLVELLTVVALMIVFLALTVPAMNSMLAGLNISRGGQLFADQIILGRQNALTRNRDVEVRFINLSDGMNRGYRGVQIWMVDEAGSTRSPISRIVTLPEGVIVNTNASYSPLLFGNGATISGQTNFSSRGLCEYKGFRFRANGQTDIPSGSSTNSQNFVTLQNVNDSASPPKNFVTIQINPFTGKLNVLRP